MSSAVSSRDGSPNSKVRAYRSSKWLIGSESYTPNPVIPCSLQHGYPPNLPLVSYPPLWSRESLSDFQHFSRHPITGYPHLLIPDKRALDKKHVRRQPQKIKAFLKRENRVPARGVRKDVLLGYLLEYDIPTKKTGFTNKRLQRDILKPFFKEDLRWLTHQVKHVKMIMDKINDGDQAFQSNHDSRLGNAGIRAGSSMWKQLCFYRDFLALQRARKGYRGLDSMTISYKLPWEDRHCCWPPMKERHGWPWAALTAQGPYNWAPYWWNFRQEGDLPLYTAKRPTAAPPDYNCCQIGPSKEDSGPGFEHLKCDYGHHEPFHCN